jgi:ATP phosphoribosyltransferase regulatory subunit
MHPGAFSCPLMGWGAPNTRFSHTMTRWLLPERISDALPSEARRIEELRRRLLDLYRSYGYELVRPPLIEHLDSLMTGAASDLALRTFQLVDQLSGRTLGVRADMTPQVARIDAHQLARRGVVRLCYAGSVLHARPSGLAATREPIQIGAELYGHAGVEADLEVLDLVVRSLTQAGARRVRVDLCHMGIVPALLAQCVQPGPDPDGIYALLEQKDVPELTRVLASQPAPVRQALLALPTLYSVGQGDARSTLARALAQLPALAGITAALDELSRLLDSPIWARLPQLELAIDLADLRGYRYHNGISFAAYVDGLPSAIARGGRYDNVGQVFGRARPATGFSLELRELAMLAAEAAPVAAVRAPWSDDPDLLEQISQLRASGHIVVQTLPGHEDEQQEFACDRELTNEQGRWVLRPMQSNRSGR